jgi:hypothetical protein
MKIELKTAKILSIPIIVIVAIWLDSCAGGDGNGGKDPEIPSIFSNFYSHDITAIANDASGGKWVSTVDGVSYFHDNGTPTDKTDDTWTTFTIPESLSLHGVRDIAIDSL